MSNSKKYKNFTLAVAGLSKPGVASTGSQLGEMSKGDTKNRVCVRDIK